MNEKTMRLREALAELAREAERFISWGRKCPPGCPCGYDEAEARLRATLSLARKTIGEE